MVAPDVLQQGVVKACAPMLTRLTPEADHRLESAACNTAGIRLYGYFRIRSNIEPVTHESHDFGELGA